jgi:hypothetical protein
VGQPRDEEQVRRRLHETFLKSRPEVEAALAKCFADPKTVLACVELLAGLDGELPLRDGKVADRATGAATGITGENSGVANLTPFQPGQSGNLAGRPQGDGLMRKHLMKAFLANEKQIAYRIPPRTVGQRSCLGGRSTASDPLVSRGQNHTRNARSKVSKRSEGHLVCEEKRGPRAPAHWLGDRSVPGFPPSALVDGWIDCTGSRLASRSRPSATRANAASNSVRSACSRSFAWLSRLISLRSS